MERTIKAYRATYDEDGLAALMTAPELAEYLGIGRNRAYELLRNGAIKGFRIGCVWKVSKAAVDRYICEKSGLA